MSTATVEKMTISTTGNVLTDEQVRQYQEDGFVVAKNFVSQPTINRIWEEVRAIFMDQAQKLDLMPDDPDDTRSLILNVLRPDTPERTYVYDLVRNIMTVRAVQTSFELDKALRQIGLKMPISLQIPTIRFDLPGESKFLLPIHQDLRSIRSPKCVTVWWPLTPVNDQDGSIAVFPGTHKLGLLGYKIVNRQLCCEVADQYDHKDAVIVDAVPGDIVFMDSLALHYSHPGPSENIKMNAQIMFNDALEMNMGDKFEKLGEIPDAKDLR